MKKIFWIFKKIPLTIIFLTLFMGTALLSGTHIEEISETWLQSLGFASTDLLELEWWRILTALFITIGGAVFWRGVCLVGILMGTMEWKFGTRKTLLAFFGIHAITLLLLSGIVFFLQAIHHPMGSIIAFSRDVGPSAGYFGVLGFLIVSSQKQYWRYILFGIIWGSVLVTLFIALQNTDSIAISAALAHCIAFPLGWMYGKKSVF